MKVTLCGVALSAFVSSITAAILILDEQTLLAMRTWLVVIEARLGDAGYVRTVFSGIWCWPLPCTPLNMLALGDRMAQGLGVSVLHANIHPACDRVARGAAVSIAGPIGFVGLLVPQIVRRLVSADLRVLLPFQLVSARFCYYWQILLPGRFSRPMS